VRYSATQLLSAVFTMGEVRCFASDINQREYPEMNTVLCGTVCHTTVPTHYTGHRLKEEDRKSVQIN